MGEREGAKRARDRKFSAVGAGLNTGSVLIRNTEWSRTLIADMATYGKYPVDWSKEEMLRAAVPSYDIGMYEQNMLVWRLMNEPDIMAKV